MAEQPILIAGMHRSGTSMVAELLYRCGLALGEEDQFLPANEDNPTGYWEINGIDLLGNRILEQLGGDWAAVPSVLHSDEWMDRLDQEALKSEALDLLSNVISQDKPWGWKDPRNTILLPFWKTLFPELKLIVCLRNPLEVAFSLSKRFWASISFEESLTLWRDYYALLRTHTGDTDVLVTHYESYFWKPQPELERLCDFSGLSPAVDVLKASVQQAIRSEFYRGIATDEMLRTTEGLPEDLLELFDFYGSKAGNIYQELLDDPKHQQWKYISAVQRNFATSAAAFDQASGQIASLQSSVARAKAELSRTTDHLHETEAELSRTTEFLNDTETELTQTRLNLDERQAELAQAAYKLKQAQAGMAFARKSFWNRIRTILQLARGIPYSLKSLLVYFLKMKKLRGEGIPERLFDKEWYLEQRFDVAIAGVNAFRHYRTIGWKEGSDPNPYFNVNWYLSHYPDVTASGIEPLKHYCYFGWKEGRDPSPYFNSSLYLQNNRDVAGSGINPLYHYLRFGKKEGRSSCAPMDRRGGVKVPREQSPLIIYEDSLSSIAEDTASAFQQAEGLSTYEEEAFQDLHSPPVKLLAFYLPQFHPIPENDEYWGAGFTEWTNVSKARPIFEGHYQPRLPGELGFYDLRVPEVMERQVELAKQHGIHGFCFYHYWFNGKRVLERPLDQFLQHSEFDINFCICWANENWTRRWDGLDDEILLKQHHSPENDLRFIQDAIPYLSDPRYIKIDGKPLLLVYRPNLIEGIEETSDRWREFCHAAGLGGLFLSAPEAFGFDDPRKIGFDALVEFPPLADRSPRGITHEQKFFVGFKGQVRDYANLKESYFGHETDFLKFKTIAPNWDNTARRGMNAMIFHGSTPELYESWLTDSLKTTIANMPREHRYLFINAWNEWAEGTYLEPDRKFGYAYLNATARALKQASGSTADLLVVASQADDNRTRGSLKDLLEWLRNHTSLETQTLFEKGNISPTFAENTPAVVFEDLMSPGRTREDVIHELKEKIDPQLKAIYIYSLPSAELISDLSKFKLPIVCNLHSQEDARAAVKTFSDQPCTFICDESVHVDFKEDSVRYWQGAPAGDEIKTRSLQLLDLLWRVTEIQPRVSVVVPCFNHARFLPQRLDTIFNQTFQDFEVILLDDASSDETAQILKDYSARYPTASLEINEENSGSPFIQWATGIQKARADIVWIAEDDDYCEDSFLETLIPAFEDRQVKLAYTASYEVDQGDRISGTYEGYLGNISQAKWKQNYSNQAYLEIQDALASHNTIPNVSAVLFRTIDIEPILDQLQDFKFAGDWFFYLHAIQWGKIFFHAAPLNYHRRHSQTAMAAAMSAPTYFQELGLVHRFALENFVLEKDSLDRMMHRVKSEWEILFPDHSTEELGQHYPVIELERRIHEGDFLRARKIAIVIAGFYFGGAEVFPIRLANHFAEIGHEVFIYNSKVLDTNPDVRRMVSPLTRVVEAPGNQAGQHFRTFLRNEKIEFINSQGWEADQFVMKHIGDMDTPWVVSMHGHHEAILSGEMMAPDFPSMMPGMIDRVDRFVYVHPKNRAVFEEYPLKYEGQAAQSGPLGISSELPVPYTRAQLGIGQSDLVLGMTARGIPEKGWEETIRCVNILNSDHNDKFHLLLIGDSPYVQELKSKHENENIHFLGFSEGLAWNQICDVGLLPTFYTSETHPLTIVEHLACGNPVLSTYVGQIPHMLDVDGETAGFVLELAENGRPDSQEMARVLALYLKDPDLLVRHRRLARRALSNFDMNISTDEYLEIFTSCRSSSREKMP